MAETIIKVQNIDLTYPVYSIKAQSLRNSIANIAIGGRLMKSGSDIVHVRALSNVSFELFENDRLAIMGHNGAGKSTLLKVLAGVYEPTKGDIVINGNISSMIDIGLGLNITLTGRENIITMARMRGFSPRQTNECMPSIIEFSELGNFIDVPVSTYSSGMQMRLAFAVATALEPDILLFDEWLGVGDVGFIEKAQARLDDVLLRSRGMVLATHSAGLAKTLCNRLLYLQHGQGRFFEDIDEGLEFAGYKL